MSQPQVTTTTAEPDADAGLEIHELASIFPSLGDAELQGLAGDIAANGLLEPITLYEGKILDGRSRYQACQLAGIEPRFIGYAGDNPVAFVKSKNLARRDLTEAQRAAALLKLEEYLGLLRAEARSAHRAGSARGGKAGLRGDQPSESRDVHARIAKDSRTSRGTVSRVARVKLEAPDLFEKVAAGEMEAKRAERVLRERKAAERAADVRERKLLPVAVNLREGAFQDVLADVRNVDLVFTDPPYPREYLPLWSDLAVWAAKR